VTVDYTVTGAGAKPTDTTDTVSVSDGNGHSCSGTLMNGNGHCTITAFTGAAGASVTLIATYAGDTNNSGSVSAPYSTTD
jgi:hypothetical protein